MTIADIARAAEASRRSWAAALATDCPAGHAEAGQPCWSTPVGLCSRRIRAAGFTGTPGKLSSTPDPRRTPKDLDRKIRETRR